MSQAAAEKALGKLITDECYRRRFFKEPGKASCDTAAVEDGNSPAFADLFRVVTAPETRTYI
jgi:hypothetical protein